MRGYIECIMSCTSKTIVACYTLEGELVKTYPSALNASKSRHLFKRTIDRCIRGDIKVVKNLQWKRFKVGEVPTRIPPLEINTKSMSVKPVAKLDENDQIIKVYPSISKAALENDIDRHSLRDILNKKYAYIGKTKFRYLSDNEIDKYKMKKGQIFDRKIKPIIQYDLNGKYIKTYPSIKAATIAMGKKANSKGISQCLKGQYQTAFGYIWKYKNEPNVKKDKKQKLFIYVLNAHNEIIYKFNSTKEASDHFKVTVAAINNAIRLKQKVKGYHWIRK